MKGLGRSDPRVLAGQPGDNEDSVVVRFPEGMALVQTVDFFTPMLNDPFRFGRIAAANALSDVYAMGGTPLSAMNIVCFPIKKLPGTVLNDILRGGQDAVAEAGAVSAGGHSVEDDEIKYGLAVSGVVVPSRMATNRGARPGDVLVLTKPLGTGVLATAVKAEWEGWRAIEDTLFTWCGRLNKGPGEVITELGLIGATDVTGFGLAGHGLELAEASDVDVEISLSAAPLMDRALELTGMGLLPAGSICNRNHYLPRCRVAEGLDPLTLDLVFDAQTSGGLLLCVPPDKLDRARELLAATGDQAYVIGRVLAHEPDGPHLRIVA